MEYDVIGKPIETDKDGRVLPPSPCHNTTSSGPFQDRAEAERTVRGMMSSGRFWAAWIEESK